MRKNLLIVCACAILALASACGSPGGLVDQSLRDLSVPNVSGRQAIPLRVAVHVHPAVVRDSHDWFGKGWWGDLGPEVVDAATEYFPQAFAESWLLADFPNPRISENVDVVVVIESSGSVTDFSGPFDFDKKYDNELTLGVYTLDGNLIKRYATVGSGAHSFSPCGGGCEANRKAMIEQASVAVRPSMRKALLEFPVDDVLKAVDADRADLALRLERAGPDYWQKQREVFQAGIAAVRAKWPVASGGNAMPVGQDPNTAAAVASALNAQKAGRLQPGLRTRSATTALAVNQVAQAYVLQMYGNSAEGQLAQATLNAALAVYLGGRSPTQPSSRLTAAADCRGPKVAPIYSIQGPQWKTFPIALYIDEPGLVHQGVSAERAKAIANLLMEGVTSWAAASHGKVGAIVRTDSPAKAQVRLEFASTGKPGEGYTVHDSVSGDTLHQARIIFDTENIESRAGRETLWVTTSAHEMGHVLGITGHPMGDMAHGTLMSWAELHKSPLPIDINSILVRYRLACS